ncbi:hypothetical protein CkaCkLH20_10940 [Colletotrichum karsti]|uniref:Uncharacterized protein n=1 Tax=Colletotrichum karsti TaxID=1095194 RepID=A0A9P6LDE2_9PEZI|nr:uncharacterized protein CkaCkLH20_10940 [Colletotrichum karsti]KAF9871529.1 hypothetical protein CkaCkLH20_10940 [Colletotrichum karsti]
MSSIETSYLKAILRDAATSTMSGNYYESAMVIPGMHASAMPRRPAQPAPASSSNAAAMASEVTLVDKNGELVQCKEKVDANSAADGSSPSRKGLLKRILKKA